MPTAFQLLWLAGFVFGSLQAGYAQERDPVFPWATIWEPDDVFSSATKVDHDFVEWCQVGPHTFLQEKTTLSEILHALGKGFLKGNGGDAAAGEMRVDYTDGKNLIRFSSNNEMGGITQDLDGIEIRSLMPGEKAAPLPELMLPITFPFGACGMTFRDLERRLGSATVVKGRAAYVYDVTRKIRNFYNYSGKERVKIPGGEMIDLDVNGILEAKVSDGRVVAFRISHLTSE
jgi:hypothetical protein